MKKLIPILSVAVCMASCAESEIKKEETNNSSTESTTTVPTESDRRTKEIADSTKMLDKKLADPNDVHTPDSLK